MKYIVSKISLILEVMVEFTKTHIIPFVKYKVFPIVKKLLLALGVLISKLWKLFLIECQKREIEAAEYQKAYAKFCYQEWQGSFQQDYQNVKAAVSSFLGDYYQTLGLQHPHSGSELQPSDDAEKVTGNQQNVIFNYKCLRKTPDFAGGLQPVNRMSAQEIQKTLNTELYTYISEQGYTYQDVHVEDISNNMLKIQIVGVDIKSPKTN